MRSVLECPSCEDLARYGNLVVSCWAPPQAVNLADDTYRSLLSRLLDGAEDILVLGYRPGRLAGLPSGVLNPRLAELLSRSVSSAAGRAFVRLDPAIAQAHADLLAHGAFPLRHRFLDDTGRTRIRFVSAGTLLLVTAPDAVEEALVHTAPAPGVSVTAGVLTNPFGGLDQQEARELRRLIEKDPARLTVLWSGVNRAIRLHAVPGMLHGLCTTIAERLAQGEVP